MSKWTLTGTEFSKEQIVTDGNRFLCANGYIGLRGVFEEADSSMFPAITLAGVYDQYQDRWREPVNAPHCLYAKVFFNGKPVAMGAAACDSHRAGVDYGEGVYRRKTHFGPVTIRSERFVSMAETHLLCDRLILACSEAGEVTLRRYYEITGDRSLLEDGGAEVILQCARFYISRASCHADRDEVDFPDVIGPDEYHERVTNNAFTNRMIRHTMESALLMKEIFADRPEWFTDLIAKLDFARDWQRLQDLCRRISPMILILTPLPLTGITTSPAPSTVPACLRACTR